MTKQVMMEITPDRTMAQDNAIAKVAEGLIEMGFDQASAVDMAEDQLDYFRVGQHFDAVEQFTT